jgi:flagellar motor switch/type III secretory pathway protein FliN
MGTAAAQSPITTSPANALQKKAVDRDEAKWRPVLGLSLELSVDLLIPNFCVGDFLRLRPGSVVSTNWRLTRDVPLRANGVLIAWAEFERTEKKLAIRLTELA